MRLIRSLAVLACLSLAGAAAAADAPQLTATAELKGADGASVGSAELTDAPGGVLLRVKVKGLAPGWHGLHFHEKGDCGTPDFKSAGPHMHRSAAAAVHGLLNRDATESGDLPNIHVAADGTGEAEFFTPSVSLRGGGRPALLDTDGAALVVHANADDHMTQPIGGAGGRIACGVITGR